MRSFERLCEEIDCQKVTITDNEKELAEIII